MSCVNPYQNNFACDLDYSVFLLNSKIKMYSNMILLNTIMIIVLISIVLILAHMLYKIISGWRKSRNNYDNQVKKDLQVSSSSYFTTTQLLDAKNDNETYYGKPTNASDFAEGQDDYYKFEKNINKSIDFYKNYKTNVLSCQNNPVTEEVVISDIVDKNHDNY